MKHAWIVVGLVALASPALAQRAEVIGANLELRRGPSTNAPVMRLLRQGDQLDVLERQNGWTRLRQPAGDGWALDSGLRFPTASAAATPSRISLATSNLSLSLPRAQGPGQAPAPAAPAPAPAAAPVAAPAAAPAPPPAQAASATRARRGCGSARPSARSTTWPCAAGRARASARSAR
ncbi:MAG: SH3 domain-containing protein [Planctomycetota bacterium]